MPYVEGPNSSWPSTVFQRELESRYPVGTLAPGVKILRSQGYLAQAKQGHILIQRGKEKVAMVLIDRRRKQEFVIIMIKVNTDEMIIKVGPLAVYSMNASYKKTLSGKVIYTPGYCRVEVEGRKVVSSIYWS